MTYPSGRSAKQLPPLPKDSCGSPAGRRAGGARRPTAGWPIIRLWLPPSLVAIFPSLASLSFLAFLCTLTAVPACAVPPVSADASAGVPVSADSQAPASASDYDPDKLPYRLQWGLYTVIAEAKRDKDGDSDGKQVRIMDARGRTLRQVGSDRVDAVRLVKPLVAGEEGLLVRLSGGNGGLADFYGFGAGAASRFLVSDAVEVVVKDLDGDGTAEVVATYRFGDIDGGGEHHGPLVAAVYQWDGKRFAEATKRFPEASRLRAKEYQAQLLASEQASTPSQGRAEDKENADKENADKENADKENNDGHLNSALGYMANAKFAGDAAEAGAWLKANITSARLRMPPAELDAAALEIRSCTSPLPQQPAAAGEDILHSLPARQGRAAAASGLSATSGPSAPHALPHYKITELNLGGAARSGASSINDAGVACGTGDAPFLYRAGHCVPLMTLPKGLFTMQGVYISNTASNNAALKDAARNDTARSRGTENICGTLSQNVGIGGYAPLRAFLIRGGKASLLPGLAARANTNATGVNVAGEVAGWADTGMQSLGHQFRQHACVWQGGVLRDLGLLAGRKASTANGINSAGQVVGDVGPPEHRHAVTWGRRGLTVLEGTGDSSAAAINDKGQVVGNVGDHAERWEAGRSVSLQSLRGYPINAADGINAAGLIVGEADDALGINGHAVIWIGGKVHDLNRLASPLGAWILGAAVAINGSGQIVGRGTLAGRARVSSDSGVRPTVV